MNALDITGFGTSASSL